jgi:hypothetical protein
MNINIWIFSWFDILKGLVNYFTLVQIERCSRSTSWGQNSLFDKEGIKGRFYQARNYLFVAFADSSDLAVRHHPVEVNAANLEIPNAGNSSIRSCKIGRQFNFQLIWTALKFFINYALSLCKVRLPRSLFLFSLKGIKYNYPSPGQVGFELKTDQKMAGSNVYRKTDHHTLFIFLGSYGRGSGLSIPAPGPGR